MKNLHDASAKNPLTPQNRADAAIPDPSEWVHEHHFLAGFVHTLSHIKHLMPDSILTEDEVGNSSAGSLKIDEFARDVLKANYSEDTWQYLENYLLVGEG